MSARIPIEDRIHVGTYTVVDCGHGSPCWLWNGRKDQFGYGVSGCYSAHRIAHVLHIGPIPDGHHVHHECSQRACVNPAHLRALTPSAHHRLQPQAQKTRCVNGHEYTPENTYIRPTGQRDCRACIRARVRTYQQRKKAAA